MKKCGFVDSNVQRESEAITGREQESSTSITKSQLGRQGLKLGKEICGTMTSSSLQEVSKYVSK